MVKKTLRILGTRGVPAAHGGFETFAERLALYLVGRGWRVVVYCQIDGEGAVFEDNWRGIERVTIPVAAAGPKGTILFDWQATRHASRHGDLCLTLGYNTAIFCALLRLKGIPNVINMDGIEWRRQKWGAIAKFWFWANDWIACWLGNHLVADNPGIRDHLLSRVGARKITTIPYGADRLTRLPDAPVYVLGLQPDQYWMLVARPEPENSILEIVRAFSSRTRDRKLAVLGRFEPDRNPYHRDVLACASSEVLFLGAIYDQEVVQTLRLHAAGYLHGHQVGGTNPSLVEAMGAGNAVVAFDNQFNRWVAGASAQYFIGMEHCAQILDKIVDDAQALQSMRSGILTRFEQGLTWPNVLGQYEDLLTRWLPIASA
jgi:glycosyltransferase involved in cell wall biosynthesis